MPHITIEYSRNVEEHVDVAALLREVHDAALSTGLIPIGGLRTRVAPRDLYRIADGNERNMFVAVTARIAAGRSPEQRSAVLRALTDAADARLGAVRATEPLALSVELQEIDPEHRINRNSIHDHARGAL